MKKYVMSYVMIILIITCSSCRSVKDITMFQRPEGAVPQPEVLHPVQEHTIQPSDNLYIRVLTLDPEVNKIFNPSLAGEGFSLSTEQMFGSPASQNINGYRVTEKGTISLPILGEFELAGLTLNEAEDRIKRTAEEYLKEPSVQIKRLNFTINVLGEVSNPGFYYIYEDKFDLINALGMVNGITEFAQLNNVIINRQGNDKVYTYQLDLTKPDFYKSDAFFLQPNDLVYIPPNKLKRKGENNTTYSLLLTTISTLLLVFTLLK